MSNRGLDRNVLHLYTRHGTDFVRSRDGNSASHNHVGKTRDHGWQ